MSCVSLWSQKRVDKQPWLQAPLERVGAREARKLSHLSDDQLENSRSPAPRDIKTANTWTYVDQNGRGTERQKDIGRWIWVRKVATFQIQWWMDISQLSNFMLEPMQHYIILYIIYVYTYSTLIHLTGLSYTFFQMLEYADLGNWSSLLRLDSGFQYRKGGPRLAGPLHFK